jgi:TPP-dependent pyruvate/acetoin dehydrogenase alpha subunit
VAEDHLLAQQWADRPKLEAWRATAATTIEEAIATVQREGTPDPYNEDWCALASRHLAEAQREAELQTGSK